MSGGSLTQYVVDILSLGSMYALLALGLALVFGVMGLVNFAYGELVTITAYTMYLTMRAGLAWPLAAFCGVGAACLASVLMERLAFRPLRRASFLTLLFASFALSVIVKNAFRGFVSPRTRGMQVPHFFDSTLHIGGLSLSALPVVIVVVGVACVVALVLFMRRTRAGVQMVAAAEDFPVARLMGIRANRVISVAFAVSGALAGVAGVLWVSRSGSISPDMGFVPILKAFIAVVVGGLGSLPGAVIGGFMLAASEIVCIAFLPGVLQPFHEPISLVLVLVVLFFKPMGVLAPTTQRA